MKKLFLMGRSEAGKTSIMQALKGEKLHYEKTQLSIAQDDIIDTPGEYSESKYLGTSLACFSFEADCIAIVCAADEPFCVFMSDIQSFNNRQLIGIITKINSPIANVPMVRCWLENCGCQEIFLVDNNTGEGIDKLQAYLDIDTEKITLEEAKKRQAAGNFDWFPVK